MKKSLAILLALTMLAGVLAGCGAANTTSTTAPDTTAAAETTAAASEETAEAAAKTIDTLKIAFVPSREPQEIITATEAWRPVPLTWA